MKRNSGAVMAQAPPNIALLKYWGKRDSALNLPVADSLAVCLDDFHTTAMMQRADAPADSFVWNGQEMGPPYRSRFQRMVRFARERSACDEVIQAELKSTLPPRIGLAGSAAAMSAFALALSEFFNMGLHTRELSALARMGSGSAARSIPDGFTWWHRGHLTDGTDSFAETILSHDAWPELRILLVILDTEGKRVSSTDGMVRVSQTSPHFEAWTHQCTFLAPVMLEAIQERDFEKLSSLAKNNALTMHALCMTAQPPIVYVNSATLRVLEHLEELRRTHPLFYTLDAGPNPIVFTLDGSLSAIESSLAASFPRASVQGCRPGPGARIVKENGALK